MNFDQVYIISLDHSKEYIEELFDRVYRIPLPDGTPIFIIEAFLGKSLKDGNDTYRLYPEWNLNNGRWWWWERPTTYGEAGGMISHTMCWEDAYNNGYENILILEDDFKILKEIDWEIFNELEGYDWEFCLLGHNSLHNHFSEIHPQREIKMENFVRPTFFYNTQSYILTKEGIRKLVEEHLPTLKQNIIVSDEFLSAVISTHPRKDLREMYISNISAVATREDFISQTRFESAGNSLTEPTEDDTN